jgi:hypothetical protein
MRKRRDLLEYRPSLGHQTTANCRRDIALQLVHAGIGVRPLVGQRSRVKSAGPLTHVIELEQPRPFRDKQADGELNRRHVID